MSCRSKSILDSSLSCLSSLSSHLITNDENKMAPVQARTQVKEKQKKKWGKLKQEGKKEREEDK